MDDVGLATLEAETREDLRIIVVAAGLARIRYGSGGEAELEAAAYQLARMYNAIEQLAMRVARAFENHVDEAAGWHVELVRRLSLTIDGVRPALFPAELHEPLLELRGFRHVVRHAYDVRLDPARVARVIEQAEQCAVALPGAVATFFATARPTCP